MPDPGDSNFVRADWWKKGRGTIAGALRKERWNQDLGQEIALMPVEPGL